MSEHVTQRISPVGRDAEKELLAQTIAAQGTTIVYLEGDAGIGKTTLLDVAAELARNQGVLCPPTIDFYDTEMHSHQGVQATIADALDPSLEGTFGEYRRCRRVEPQQELWSEFLTGYCAAAEGCRVLLRFDTVERLAYERDSEEVLRDCEIEDVAAPSWQWLLQRIGALPNTTVIIAARPVADNMLRNKLQEAYGDRFLSLELAGFSLLETQAYFSASEFGQQVVAESPEMVNKAHILSAGRPILIALALDWLYRGIWDRGTLETIQQQDFERIVVEQVRTLKTPLDKAIKYVALCRKGCNAGLLARLMGIGPGEADRLTRQLLELSFVKPPRPGSREMFFLHDEMYDLVEKYVWLADWPDYREQARLDRVIIDRYTGQIEAYRELIRQARGWQARGRLRREQQLLISERVFYQFDEDPRLGYREYSHLDEEAIAQRELEWDAWLRNEAVWFTAHRAWRRGDHTNLAQDYPRRDPAGLQNGEVVRSPAVDYDCRRRWVSRYIAHNKLLEAVKITEKLLVKPQLSEEPELYRGGVQIAQATAQAYLAGEHIEAAIGNFDTGIGILQAVPTEHQEPWLHSYLLGNAYLYKGLAVRGILSLDQAALAYSRAIHYFREIGYRPGQAEATNNLAYVLVRLGRPEPALRACNEGLRIRQELGDEYGIGLSLNTKGIIHERLANPVTAIQNSEQALAIFREIGNVRGIMMAHINLGRAYRRMARSVEWGQENADFEKGKHYLEEAVHARNPDTDEFYQVEALDELGCLYRDWAATLHEKGEQEDRIPAFLDVAEDTLQNAVNLTLGHNHEGMPRIIQHVDLLEDLAHVHYWRERLAIPCDEGSPLIVMEDLLGRAETLAKKYLKSQAEIKVVLSKVLFQRARLARLKRQATSEVARYYGLAAGYAESYSWDAPEARKTATDVCDWLGELNDEEAKQAIRAVYDALQGAGLHSRRLRDNIENVVKPLLGVDWQATEPEASDG